MSLVFRTVFVVVYHDGGCPEEGCPPSNEMAYLAWSKHEAADFIERCKRRSDSRWEKMEIREHTALVDPHKAVDPDTGFDEALLVEPLSMGPQPGWKRT
jgi:hypothetical protein